ncbi:GNAT family N-acetyltransferase [Vacuolonema iberomarrocanum]|uniref:GNAT family N-acetyltransferase n=1 Tax=Vacuolonema iberomarrocanum TaxID=3454632 RepID=UPI001A005A82|nr:GNAT family N-acetyltransferase [filamentous cyanobacterium LEGE 07170]
MPITRIYDQSDFPAILKWQALAFMRVEWPYIFEDDELFLTETYPPELNPIHFVVTEGETLMSYAAMVRTTLVHVGETFRVYGFGNMFTFPPYRKEGHGHKLLGMATELIETSDVDVGILYCDEKVESFYAAKGWIKMASPTRFGDPAQYEDGEEQRMMVFVSEKGRRYRHAFEEQPLYVDWTW